MPTRRRSLNAIPPGEIVTKGGSRPLAGGPRPDPRSTARLRSIGRILASQRHLASLSAHGNPRRRARTHRHPRRNGNTPVHRHCRRTPRASPHEISRHRRWHNGNTILERIDGSFLNTSLVAKGAVVGTPGKKGRTVTLDVTMDKARIEDVLLLAVKAQKADDRGAEAQNEAGAPPGEPGTSSRNCTSTANSRSPMGASRIPTCRRKSTS